MFQNFLTLEGKQEDIKNFVLRADPDEAQDPPALNLATIIPLPETMEDFMPKDKIKLFMEKHNYGKNSEWLADFEIVYCEIQGGFDDEHNTYEFITPIRLPLKVIQIISEVNPSMVFRFKTYELKVSSPSLAEVVEVDFAKGKILKKKSFWKHKKTCKSCGQTSLVSG